MIKSIVLLVSLCAAATGTAVAVNERAAARIIGGEIVDIIKHGYLVSLRYRATRDSAYLHKCAGVLYNNRTVVTSAQCVHEVAVNDNVVVVVAPNTRTGVDGTMHRVTKWIANPNYTNWLMDYDVGLFFLETPLNLAQSDHLRTIAIRELRPVAGKLGTVAGWGYREEFGPSSYQLEDTQVPIVSTSDCAAAYGAGELTDRMICAGYLQTGGKDACQGDTGGPLVVENELVGLVSWGRGCARPGFPGVYTFVPAVRPWIDQTISANV